MNFRVTCLLILSLLLLLPTAVLAQQGVTAFNYQGQIFDAGGQPVTGQCDFSFQIYDTVDSPTALATLQIDDLSVADGLFSVSIDFGPDVFDTSPRWLETAVRCESDPDFDSLGRQQILSVPYATYAYGVDWANVKNRPEYTVGPGLTLTGTEFSIPAAFQLPHDCADNEIPKWSGSSWACAVDSNSDTLVTLSCEVGQVAEWRANGWACSTPSGEGTTYTAGVGLSLTGTQFSIPIPYQLPQGCAAGERASWTGSRWACTRTVDAYTKAEVDTALTGKIDATEVYTTAEINSWLAAVQADLAGKIDGTDVYTTSQVDSLLERRADISHTHTAVATATVALAVDWGDIINVPAGLADGTDDSDDLVSWSEISGIVGTGATDVARGNHTHTYADPTNGTGVYLEYKPNNIACMSNQVLKWDAAGSRWVCGNASGGDITGVTAGSGLTGGGASGSVTLGADFAGTGNASTVARSDHNHDADYYTQGQVDTALATKVDATEVYTAAEIDSQMATVQADLATKIDASEVYTTGQLDAALAQKLDASDHTWSGLLGVPAGFSDDTDDTDDTVSWTEISGIVGTGATEVAGGSHNHGTDYYTQGQVDTALAGKIDATEAYTTGQVDAALAQKLDTSAHTWSGLSGVPAGFSDDTDDTDDTVGWSEISGIVGTGATNVAGGSHNHDTDYYTQGQVDTALAGKIDSTEVYTTGQMDSQMATVQADLATKIDATEVYTTGQMDSALAQKLDASDHTWSGLSGVPAGFSDDTDDTDDAVSWSEISGIVGTGATNVAGGSHNHDTAYVDEGQTDSITSAMVTDGSITSADLQDGAALAEILDDDGTGSGLDADKLDGQDSSAFATSSHNHDTDYYTQGQVDTALALKIDGTEVYTTGEIDSQMATVQADLATKIDASEVYTTGQVDAVLAQKLDASDHTWSGLSGVPSGFSDDTDDIDDTVSWLEISGIVGTGLTNVAGGSHNHDTAYVNEGQTDSITSAMVMDGSITSADLQDGAALDEILDDDGAGSGLDADRLDGQDSSAFATSSHNHDTDYYTQGQVDTALAGKIDSTEVYTTGQMDSQMATVQADLATKIDATEVYTTGQMDSALAQKLDASDHTWSGLSGVPAGFSDDTDDTDDAVSWSEISGIVGTGATNVAGGSHNHDTAYVDEGQTDSITSAMVTDGSITSADLQDGAALAEILDDDGTGSGLDADKLDGQDSSAFATSSHNHDTDYYTQGQVDTALALKIDGTEVYTTGEIDSQMATVQADLATKIDASEVYTTGQVDAVLAQKLDASDHTWSGLSGVPSGFSDDTDDIDDTVSWLEISGIVGTGLTNVAGGSHNHDTAYVNEGQTDSITSAMVMDGSITSADLQDGAALAEILDDDGSGSGLDADKLDGQSSSAFASSGHAHDSDYYTQGQVDTALADKIDATEVYTTGQVDAALAQKLDATDHTWSGLSGVPAGFSDDTDDTNDTVSWSEISGIVGTGATEVAGGSHNHDAAYVDEGQTDSITSAMITDGSVTSADLQDGAALAEILDDDGSGSSLDADKLDGQDGSYYWSAGGNAATSGDFVGTTNSEPLVFKTNDLVGLRIDQGTGAATDAPAVVGGYSGNTYSTGATIAGGGRSNAINRATGGYSFVGGGLGNAALEAETTIGGGYGNTVGSGWSTIGGGESNTVNADWSFIGGGFSNQVTGGGTSVVAGGATNSASGAFSFVGGGESNTVSGDYSVVAGGYQNVLTSTANYASVGGGRDNQASGSYAVIGGGNGNTASSGSSTVGGGTGNVASSSSATVSGGQSNTASGGSSAIGGGQSNTASANWGTVSGGYNNTVSSSYSTIGGGFGNQISSTGLGAAIPGGLNNAAPGATSFAAGRQAKANHDGAFVWGDSTSADIASNAGNSVTFRATGGYRLFTNSAASTGASLAAGGGSWASMSDRNQKENLQPVDTQALLEQVGQLPLSTWNYISQDDDIRHIGPMAQDFHAAFGVGENETTITAIDGDGVSLAAIQALYERIKALEAENEALKAENEAEKARLDVLEARLDVLEAAVQ